jgi:hypothetical protein
VWLCVCVWGGGGYAVGLAGKRRFRARLLPLELQRLFTRMQLLECGSVSSERLTTHGFQWKGNDVRVQHDVSVSSWLLCHESVGLFLGCVWPDSHPSPAPAFCSSAALSVVLILLCMLCLFFVLWTGAEPVAVPVPGEGPSGNTWSGHCSTVRTQCVLCGRIPARLHPVVRGPCALWFVFVPLVVLCMCACACVYGYCVGCRLYKGSSVSQKRCLECGNVREKVEDIYAVDVGVKGFPDVVAALAQATNFEDMVDGNAVECPVCERKVPLARPCVLACLVCLWSLRT